MKKSLSMISSALLLSAMLAACNTDTEQTTNTPANENETTETEVESTETDTTTVEETTTDEQTDNQTEQPSDDNTSEEATETTLTYTSNGKEVSEKAVISTSEEQGYSISHLENYTLVAEEPGIDRLMFNDDDSLSMQIKVASTEVTTFDNVKATAVDTMAAIASEGNYKELDLVAVKATASDIQNIIGYETVIDSEKITIVTFEKGSKIITLTIYDTEEADLTDSFLKMGLTIQ